MINSHVFSSTIIICINIMIFLYSYVYIRYFKELTILNVSLIYVRDMCLSLMPSKTKNFLVLPFSKNKKI